MTAISAEDLGRMREEVAIATFPEGGLLLHLSSGEIFQLDAATSSVWNAVAQAQALDEAIATVQLALGLTPEQARLCVEKAISQVRAIDKAPPSGIYQMEERGTSLALWKAQRRLLELDRQKMKLTLFHRMDPANPTEEDDVAALLRLLIPKILSAWFPLAMHASALATEKDHALLFSGASGAGKTTTARALAEGPQAMRLLSEDVVLFATVGAANNTIMAGAEPIIHAWIEATAARFIESPAATPGVQDLVAALKEHPQLIPLRKVVFLDVSRRQGASWSLKEMGRAQALRAFFLNSFLPWATPPLLRAHLIACRAAAASGARAWEATTIPEGVDELRRSSHAQREMIAS
jgi:hypothetical protein